ncbi:phospholipase D-like domain-containing protein [Ralstonia solanacearum]|uniref:phospholipase D-like domain-containing protein n=1 Tax=Ralstonia solanacearum TaxID=305 RepID=UPI001FF9C837|nr:phospholipase D-like domain-containing protein [Ralstonia solanacearum]MDB0527384.1 phospholipase D-like domain-containing protein [Ralstonia solanacearum]
MMLLAAALWLAGCASLPHDVERPVSTALSDAGSASALGRLAQAAAPSAEVSGFRLIPSGEAAYATLLTLADRAERTLDLQYYIIDSDSAVRELMRHVLVAAARGVRVRVLVDDLHSAGRDLAFLKFSSHRNVEVRLFNPFPGGRMSNLTRLLSAAAEFRRVNRRMHNKVFIADNALAVTGGRNLGAEYFTQVQGTHFVDLDVLAAGLAVRQLSSAFDAYWNSAFAYPVEALAPEPGKAHPPEAREGNYPPPVVLPGRWLRRSPSRCRRGPSTWTAGRARRRPAARSPIQSRRRRACAARPTPLAPRRPTRSCCVPARTTGSSPTSSPAISCGWNGRRPR